jgi:hypothetical protein
MLVNLEPWFLTLSTIQSSWVNSEIVEILENVTELSHLELN